MAQVNEFQGPAGEALREGAGAAGDGTQTALDEVGAIEQVVGELLKGVREARPNDDGLTRLHDLRREITKLAAPYRTVPSVLERSRSGTPTKWLTTAGVLLEGNVVDGYSAAKGGFEVWAERCGAPQHDVREHRSWATYWELIELLTPGQWYWLKFPDEVTKYELAGLRDLTYKWARRADRTVQVTIAQEGVNFGYYVRVMPR